MQERGDGSDGNLRAIGAVRTIWRQVRTNLRARARLRRQQTARARTEQLKYVSPDQLAYADWLDGGIAIGRYFLAATFLLYVFGLTTPKIPLAELPAYWSMSAGLYSALAGVGTGWGWLAMVGHGDYMNFLGIAFLSSLTIVCYLRLLPLTLRRKDFTFASILAIEIVVLVLAASGLLAVGH
ncbi:MAG TPA: hypothetical protein VIH40_07410 [Xanthobacteraceae bacterium]